MQALHNLSEFRAAGAKSLAESIDAEQQIDASLPGYRRALGESPTLVANADEKAAFADIVASRQKYFEIDKTLRALGRQGNLTEAMALMLGPGKSVREAIEKDIQTIVDINLAGAVREGQMASNDHAWAVAAVCTANAAVDHRVEPVRPDPGKDAVSGAGQRSRRDQGRHTQPRGHAMPPDGHLQA